MITWDVGSAINLSLEIININAKFNSVWNMVHKAVRNARKATTPKMANVSEKMINV